MRVLDRIRNVSRRKAGMLMIEGALPREKITPIPSRGFERALKHNAWENMRNPPIRSAPRRFFHGQFG